MSFDIGWQLEESCGKKRDFILFIVDFFLHEEQFSVLAKHIDIDLKVLAAKVEKMHEDMVYLKKDARSWQISGAKSTPKSCKYDLEAPQNRYFGKLSR